MAADTIGHLSERALDTSTGKFFDPPAAVTNLQEWRASRDRATGQASDQSDDRTGRYAGLPDCGSGPPLLGNTRRYTVIEDQITALRPYNDPLPHIAFTQVIEA